MATSLGGPRPRALIHEDVSQPQRVGPVAAAIAAGASAAVMMTSTGVGFSHGAMSASSSASESTSPYAASVRAVDAGQFSEVESAFVSGLAATIVGVVVVGNAGRGHRRYKCVGKARAFRWISARLARSDQESEWCSSEVSEDSEELSPDVVGRAGDGDSSPSPFTILGRPVPSAVAEATARTNRQAAVDLRLKLSPGPLEPHTPAGLALIHWLSESPEAFPLFWDYELIRSCESVNSDVAQAEALILKTYMRFAKTAGAPPRPAADSLEEDVDEYSRAFGGSANQALENDASPDFQLIAKAHIFGQMQGASFPRMPISKARSLYANAMRFGFALRQAETRCQAERAVGTLMPLPLEDKLIREELEALWACPAARPPPQTPPQGDARVAAADSSRTKADVSHDEDAAPVESDEHAAHRSLQEVLTRLQRIGETRPNLATYLGWLGKYDPEALSLLATPTPAVAAAMRLQVSAVWGESSSYSIEDDVGSRIVPTTPSDMLEAVLFGAWLQDAGIEAEHVISRHHEAPEFGDGLP